jgi:hypothetical protein
MRMNLTLLQTPANVTKHFVVHATLGTHVPNLSPHNNTLVTPPILPTDK